MSLTLPLLPMMGVCQTTWGPNLIRCASFDCASATTGVYQSAAVTLNTQKQGRHLQGSTLELKQPATPSVFWRQPIKGVNAGAYFTFSAEVTQLEGTAAPALQILARKAGTHTWQPQPCELQITQQGMVLSASFEATATDMEVALYSTGVVAAPARFAISRLKLQECLSPSFALQNGKLVSVNTQQIPALAAQPDAKGHISLSWQTTTPDSNVLYYQLERWVPGTGWKVLAMQPAGTLPTAYSYTDLPGAHTPIYRVVALGWDDQRLYNTRPVEVLPTATAHMAVYPNPATSEVTIQSDQPLALIYDDNGNSVWQGQPGQTISLQQLPKGTYYIQAGQQHEVLIVQK